MNRKEFKKGPEELQEYLQFKRRGSYRPAKKGRGAQYNRQDFKNSKI